MQLPIKEIALPAHTMIFATGTGTPLCTSCKNHSIWV